MCFMCDIFTLSNLCICDLAMFRLFRKGTSNSVFIFFLRITNAFFFVVVAKSPTKQKKKQNLRRGAGSAAWQPGNWLPW